MQDFDYASSGYELDMTEGRIFYFYHDTSRFWKYVDCYEITDKSSDSAF